MNRKIRYRPLHNGVLIKEHDALTKTTGGIILPDTAKRKINQGVVVAVGPGAWSLEKGIRLPMDTKVGDEVTWQQYGGAEIKVDGQDFILVRESEINGILDAMETAPETASSDSFPLATPISQYTQGVPEVSVKLVPGVGVVTTQIPKRSG